MKANYYIAFLLFGLCFFFHCDAVAQNLRGDTIQVDLNRVVEVLFPDLPTKATLSVDGGQEGLYEVKIMGKKSLSIKALKKDAKDQYLEVAEEGGRQHLFILSYKEGSLARRIDFSSKKKLRNRADEVRQKNSAGLTATNIKFHDAAGTSNLALWEEIEAAYSGLLKVVDLKDTAIVRSRLAESTKQVQRLKEKKRVYDEAMQEGQTHFRLKRYDEARKAYQKALTEKPEDPLALKNIDLTDSVQSKDCIDKGDEARKTKKYVDAKIYYARAMSIKPDFPLLRDKFEQIKKLADPLIYQIEKDKGDKAWNANDIPGARRLYDSALSVKPGDGYITKQLSKVVIAEKKIEQEEKDEAAYQDTLAIAKSLADKAVDATGYNLAIKAYERAQAMVPARKFPKKKIDELNKIKKRLTAN